ncbi:hypothetical protein C1645_818983 [Glomus cerebriforme]|uniref:Uncharacterized protein n=1 Tax=Glomus cerebriforme TaxID=658196 RepID=A0A397T7G2_9GLOM|nr:hypothetical protein C1645_818983 [Glomus cerebriforme]
MKIKKDCKKLLVFPDFWENVTEPSLHGFLQYRKKSIPINYLNKDSEYLNYHKELEHIMETYKLETRWHRIALEAKKNIKKETKSQEIKNFWLSKDLEVAADIELKKLDLLKAYGAVQAYETGNNYLNHTSSVVESINLNNLSNKYPHICLLNRDMTVASTSTNNNVGDNNDRRYNKPEISSKRKRKYKDPVDIWEIEEIKVDYTKHPLLENYCNLLFKLQYHPVEEESQRARHISKMLKWHVVNQEMFIEVGWIENYHNHPISKPSFGLNLVSSVFNQSPRDQLHQAGQSIQKLAAKNIIGNSDNWVPLPVISLMKFFGKKFDNYFELDALTVISVISSIILYAPTPSNGFGCLPSENHVKAELWTRILSNAFNLNKTKFVPVWELQHLISGNGGRGSARSDFAAIVTNSNNLQFPFFIVEFTRHEQEVHKDNIVAVSEAIYEFNRMLALGRNLSEEEINRTHIHIGLVDGTRISFSTITPSFNQSESTFIYIHQDNNLSYNLKNDDIELDIENVLQLVVYLREKICEDGLWIETILNREATGYNYKLNELLPQLPKEAVKSKPYKTKFTPRSKRVRYTVA